MASVFADTNSTLLRSHSSSNLPDFVSVEFKHIKPSVTPEDLPRSASYSSLPIFESLSYSPEDFSASLIQGPLGNNGKAVEHRKSSVGLPQDEGLRLGRTNSLVARPKSWIQRAVRSSPERQLLPEKKPRTEKPPILLTKEVTDKPRNVTESFATFARKTWIATSRSPSPIGRIKKKDVGGVAIDEESSTEGSSIRSSSPQTSLSTLSQSELPTTDTSSSSPPKQITRKRSSLSNSLRFSQSTTDSAIGFKTSNTSDSSLSGSLSDKEATSRGPNGTIPAPKSHGKDKFASFAKESPRKKDELWSAFRALESDYQKFQAKSSALRTNVVRATLLLFLKNYAQHPSNKNLRPEDIDRRVAILNKWWTGLLEMLNGHNGQHLSGIDRPVVLEAVTGIMMRPEWRLAPSYFAPLADRNPVRALPRSQSSGSINSSASQFLADSVYHNVRNTFTQNLLSQMGMVVEKMSLRNAPASLVTFCGKAAAYAFFFCPGVADVLVSIWGISTETIRRIVDEFGLVAQLQRTSIIEDIVSEFPPNLHSLGWKSYKALVKPLRHRPSLPLGAVKIPWHGPWVARWCGRESDLFFVFCKHYHILCEEFLPLDIPLREKAKAPGFVLVHSQILTALDATIHRQQTSEPNATALSITFDDVLSGADASAAALAIPSIPISNNAARLMAENRLIMLLRDFISERPSSYLDARHTFAEAFESIMHVAVRKTSQFNHSACFITCDFMEEALTIYMRFQSSLDIYVEYIDWSFWLKVCKKMLGSHNTMTEIRLFSFIFGAWNVIASDERRKTVLCLEWLLSDVTFRKYFLHWCPMVRAYYMRLLCWRACRFDGEASQMDINIYSRISDCLKLVWSNYLHQKEDAEEQNKLCPSITPCPPAPGRRLLIIRNDNQIPTTNMFLGFDGIVEAPTRTQETAYKRHSSLAGLVRSGSTDFDIPDPSASSKKRWSLLGKIMPFSSADGPGQTQQSSPDLTMKSLLALEQVRQATASSRARPLQMIPKSSSTSSLSEAAPATPTHRPFSFKFSLEWTPSSHHMQFHPNQKPPSDNASAPSSSNTRRLLQPRLPASTHTFLVGRIPGTAEEVIPIASKEPEAKYAGRALAEWALVVKEYNNFVERRKAEGVPGLRYMEVPTLGVEGFRKYY